MDHAGVVAIGVAAGALVGGAAVAAALTLSSPDPVEVKPEVSETSQTPDAKASETPSPSAVVPVQPVVRQGDDDDTDIRLKRLEDAEEERARKPEPHMSTSASPDANDCNSTCQKVKQQMAEEHEQALKDEEEAREKRRCDSDIERRWAEDSGNPCPD